MNAPDRLVADAADRLFSRAPAADVGFDASLWEALRASGLTQILAGGAAADAVGVLRAAGYHAAAVPVCEAVLADWLAARAGLAAEEGLATIAIGTRPVALRVGDGAATGELASVPWGRHAVAVYVPAPAGDGFLRLALPGGVAGKGENLAGEPRDRLQLTLVEIQPTTGTTAEQALAMAALLRAAQMTGAMERALDLSLEHAGTRVQFGRTIGKFQAVQQMLAQLASHAAAAAASVDLAAAAHDRGAGLLEAGIAKSRTGEAVGIVAEMAHQVIAAMGFTREHPLHRVTRRMWSWRDEFGNEAFWNARLGAAVLAAGAAGAWPMIADGSWQRGGAAA